VALLKSDLPAAEEEHDGSREEMVQVGTAHIANVATAAEAAAEKRHAGENRAVEHIAEGDDESQRQAGVASPPKKRAAVRAPLFYGGRP